MKSRIEHNAYQNIINLLKEHGIDERQCCLSCNLSLNYFSNIRKGITKHIRLGDIAKLADFFDVSIDYLCDYKNARKDFFAPNYKLLARDEKILTSNFKKLDAQGRVNVAEFIDGELKRSKERSKISGDDQLSLDD